MAAAVRGVEVGYGILSDQVKGGTADGGIEEAVSLFDLMCWQQISSQ